MPVLIEAISVVVRRDAIEQRYLGGWPAFEDTVPNTTLCYDAEMARVGFMSPDDVEAYINELDVGGLRYPIRLRCHRHE